MDGCSSGVSDYPECNLLKSTQWVRLRKQETPSWDADGWVKSPTHYNYPQSHTTLPLAALCCRGFTFLFSADIYTKGTFTNVQHHPAVITRQSVRYHNSTISCLKQPSSEGISRDKNKADNCTACGRNTREVRNRRRGLEIKWDEMKPVVSSSASHFVTF